MRLDLHRNISSKQILDAIGLDECKIPRMRGVGIEDGMILIHTRTGGGNRDQYNSIVGWLDHDYGPNKELRRLKKKIDKLDEKNLSEKEKLLKREELLKEISKQEAEKNEILTTGAYTNEYMTMNKYYIRDSDDGFDTTYANFWFRIPDELREELLKLEDPITKAVFGDPDDYISAFIEGNKDAKKRIKERIKEAKELLSIPT